MQPGRTRDAAGLRGAGVATSPGTRVSRSRRRQKSDSASGLQSNQAQEPVVPAQWDPNAETPLGNKNEHTSNSRENTEDLSCTPSDRGQSQNAVRRLLRRPPGSGDARGTGHRPAVGRAGGWLRTRGRGRGAGGGGAFRSGLRSWKPTRGSCRGESEFSCARTGGKPSGSGAPDGRGSVPVSQQRTRQAGRAHRPLPSGRASTSETTVCGCCRARHPGEQPGEEGGPGPALGWNPGVPRSGSGTQVPDPKHCSPPRGTPTPGGEDAGPGEGKSKPGPACPAGHAKSVKKSTEARVK